MKLLYVFVGDVCEKTSIPLEESKIIFTKISNEKNITFLFILDLVL